MDYQISPANTYGFVNEYRMHGGGSGNYSGSGSGNGTLKKQYATHYISGHLRSKCMSQCNYLIPADKRLCESNCNNIFNNSGLRYQIRDALRIKKEYGGMQ